MSSFNRIAAAALCVALLFCASGCGSQSDSSDGSYSPIEINEGEFSTVEEWDGDYTASIAFSGSQAEINGSGAALSDSVLTISAEGEYLLSGSFDGQLVVDADGCNVRLIFSGVSINCSSSCAVYVADAKNVYITLAQDTQNAVTDGAEYVLEEDSDEPNAAIFSHDDLIFDGTGSLTVNANYNNGIRSKDDLEFLDGSYVINAVNNGISGKDSVAVKDGSFVINAGGDGIRSTNDGDEEKGWISIVGGSFDITAGQDGIQAETTLNISGGSFNITTGGGSTVTSQSSDWGNWDGHGGMGGMNGGMGGRSEDSGWGFFDSPEADGSNSAKAIKSGNNMRISGGSLTIDSSDDSIHCGGSLEINGGEFSLKSGDDGIHSDNALVINDGVINISQSYEGLEGVTIDVNGGTIDLTASDDGMNAAGGSDSSSFSGFGGFGGGGFGEGSSEYYIRISGGNININASGDGLDSNGDIFITGGTTIVSGPTSSGDAAVDYALSFEMTGGRLVAFGASGMAENASSTSTQPVMLALFSRTASAGVSITITASDGTVIYSGQPEKSFGCVIFSDPSMSVGDSVTVVIDGESAELSITDIVTTYGSQNGMGGMNGGMGGDMGGMNGGGMGGPDGPGGMGGSDGPGKR